MLQFFLTIGILHIQIAAICQQFFNADFPGVLILDAVIPPLDTALEIGILHGFGLAIAIASLWQRNFVVPDLFGARFWGYLCGFFTCFKEENIGWDAGIGCEGAIG